MDGKLDSKAFICFLHKIDFNTGAAPICFLNNASWHRSNEVCKEMKRLRLEPVFNLPYRPDLNCGVEMVNAILKQKVRKLRLEAVANHTNYTMKELVKRALKSLKPDAIKNIAFHGLKVWRSRRYYKSSISKLK